MTKYYDALETRSADQRANDLAIALPAQIARAQTTAQSAGLAGIDGAKITSADDLVGLPVLRKSALSSAQKKHPPLGGYGDVSAARHVFQSPGPIYEIGNTSPDWWRFGRYMHAAGLTADDIVQNTFSYHFTPAGMMFENGAAAIGATIFPAGTGQTEQQARVAADIGVTAYAGTPDFLKMILEKGDALGLDLSKITKSMVSGGPLFPQLRQYYIDRGISCLQCYATADLGHIAYETDAMDGMIVDEGVIVEIVTPGTGIPVAPGEIGEVVVTTLNPDYPLIRFATGDMSSIITGVSPCGRTNMRIAGWQGRADQATKVKGMFVRPEQVATLIERHPEIHKARIEVTHDGSTDNMTVRLETDHSDEKHFENAVRDVLKLRAEIEIVAKDALPKDGLVIQDKRDLT
ncbi:AMP-dependent synthetase [Amylibacter kogurei]|uniref:AMP-dependent synthetase n=1 Tax=Paramylibacter kogurei TaxID=1889778 RepID=A0A2G5K4Y4_9RHOB|nr:AMP-binding protein [Amylibacter kogurei]PIB24083.1 AMP-dependent synthetase [Amylibacter kogurei]